jgi:hypothetical protein
MRVRHLFIAILITLILAPLRPALAAESWVQGHFEAQGFLNAGMGWQRFLNAPVTEWTNDGSFAGVLGSVIPDVVSGTLPSPGQDNFMAFMEVAELDLIATLSDRAALRADLLFGRALSGSWVPGTDVEQAFLTALLEKDHNVVFTIGRFGTQAGFEPFEPYNNDAIGWSILARANLYPYLVTGAQLSMDLSEHVSLYLAVANGFSNDTTMKISDTPTGIASLSIAWGPEERASSVTITPFFGPESDSNRHFTMGTDLTAFLWPHEKVQLGLQGIFRRDNGNGGPNTNYAAGLIDVQWYPAEAWYLMARYDFAQQFEAGNGVLNLTGAEQQIHEASVGFGYEFVEGMKLKWEGRVDIVRPKGGTAQYVPGTAMALACAF